MAGNDFINPNLITGNTMSCFINSTLPTFSVLHVGVVLKYNNGIFDLVSMITWCLHW